MTDLEAMTAALGAWMFAMLLTGTIGLLHLIFLPFTSFLCLKNQRETARISWLIAIIGIPLFGSIYYLALSDDERRKTRHPTHAPPAPNKQPSPQETAQRINDVLAGRNRQT